MASTNDSDSDSLSSSSSSDDEFLTMKGDAKGGTPDREALIRRRLLESFYGASAVPEDTAPAPTQETPAEPDQKVVATSDVENMEDDADEEDQDAAKEHGASEDLDSPYFDAEAHTQQHVLGSSMHTLLETEERLALQVRTLDSTMQTLVYDNYSSFIDATEAIRSIGVSVNANEEGLGRLSRGMKVIDEQTREVEDELGALRDAVAEKVRVKRLLTRLDSLLKLPTTLQQQIANGNYRLATKSYLSAHSILSKHSVGFESLKTIETDCHDILAEMIKTLRHKLRHWGAHSSLLMEMDETTSEEDKDDWMPPPEQPKAMSEVFECAGTLFLVLPKGEEDNDRTTFDSGFSVDECKSMALSGAIRLLERLLDAHQIELQDAMFGASQSFDDDTYEAKLNRIPMTHETDAPAAPTGSSLIPTVYLDNVLEAATLFGMSFGTGSGSNSGLSESDQVLLTDFLSEAYSGFLAHVKSVLLEQSLQSKSMDADDSETLSEIDEDEDGDAAYCEVSGAMTHLLRSVRDLASGLALPEVGVDVEFAAGLVDQAVEVTEAMVRRRVAEKFFILRQNVVQESFGPFVREALALSSDNDARVVDIVQMASVALSDGLQLVDDTVRSILSEEGMASSGKEVQIDMIKEAVQGSSRRFALWLAAALERLAGCESSDPTLLIETEEVAESDVEKEQLLDDLSVPSQTPTKPDDMSEISDHHQSLAEKVESSLQEVLALKDDAAIEVISDLTLAIAEMCRLAERSVMENIQNSIASSMEEERKSHKSSLFSNDLGVRRGVSEKDTDIAYRFRLAASRVLALYALNRGTNAAVVACKSLFETACREGDEIPTEPRMAVCTLLGLVKMSCLDCANVFGGEKRAAPIPDFPEDEDDFAYSSPMVSRKSLGGRLGAAKGLQLDVERMFSEKVPVYPHPSTILDFTRDSVVTMVLKVAFRAMAEQVRSCTFSTSGYRQLQVDVALLRHMIPHYIGEDFVSEGTNACVIVENVLDDVMSNAGERCLDAECIGKEEFQDKSGETKTPIQVVRLFMAQHEQSTSEDPAKQFVIDVDSDETRR